MVAASTGATAAEFRSVADPAVVLYDAPSLKAKPLYILGHDTPLEVIVPVEGWVKVKDVDGTFGWVEKKGLAERRMLIVRPPAAEVRASADEKAALVFRAEPGVLLELGRAGDLRRQRGGARVGQGEASRRADRDSSGSRRYSVCNSMHAGALPRFPCARSMKPAR